MTDLMVDLNVATGVDGCWYSYSGVGGMTRIMRYEDGRLYDGAFSVEWSSEARVIPLAELANMAKRGLAYDSVWAEFETFKSDVREKAIEVAGDNNWCDSGLNAALDELGLEPKSEPIWEGTVTVTFSIRGTVSNSEDVCDSWVRDSIRNLSMVEMDDDWSDETVVYTVDSVDGGIVDD